MTRKTLDDLYAPVNIKLQFLGLFFIELGQTIIETATGILFAISRVTRYGKFRFTNARASVQIPIVRVSVFSPRPNFYSLQSDSRFLKRDIRVCNPCRPDVCRVYDKCDALFARDKRPVNLLAPAKKQKTRCSCATISPAPATLPIFRDNYPN